MTVALLTRHAKESVVAPALANGLGADCLLVHGFDTDTLGTFTREVPRRGSQLEAARTKARIASEISGLDQAIGSEGSFALDRLGFFGSDLELVVFLDRARSVEIVGRAQAAGLHVRERVETLDALREAAIRARFPSHGLVVWRGDERDASARKGIRSWDALEAAFSAAQRESEDGSVLVESDLRAHMHPTRMRTIAAATEDLIERLRTACPACGALGFGLVGPMPGLPCRDCRAPTEMALGEKHGCPSCRHEEIRRFDACAEPFRCGVCNP